MNHSVEPSGWAPEGPEPPRSKIRKIDFGSIFNDFFFIILNQRHRIFIKRFVLVFLMINLYMTHSP